MAASAANASASDGMELTARATSGWHHATRIGRKALELTAIDGFGLHGECHAWQHKRDSGYTNCPQLVIDPRKLAAIDIAFLGCKLTITEFAAAVFLCPALGVFVLYRGHSSWQIALGLYLISLGMNYVPMLFYAVAITRSRSARAELGEELDDKGRAMRKYRRQSLYLLVPLFVAAVALREAHRAARSHRTS